MSHSHIFTIVIALFVGYGFYSYYNFIVATDVPSKESTKEFSKEPLHSSIDNLSEEMRVDEVLERKQESVTSLKTVSNEVSVEPNTTKPIKHYKEVFKEPYEKERLEGFHERQEARKIEQASQKIIREAEAFIKEHNLTLPQTDATSEEVEALEKFEQELESLTEQLEEIEDEIQ
jgi:vacuolar-type H+-ATPase subunit I/STV1